MKEEGATGQCLFHSEFGTGLVLLANVAIASQRVTLGRSAAELRP
jgi:hypothetical protein